MRVDIKQPLKQLIRNKKHLNTVRGMPCMVCGSTFAGVAHHLLRTGEHGIAQKSGDDKTVPLCDSHHKGLHANGDEASFFATFGIPHEKALGMAKYLWNKTSRRAA